MRGKFSIRNDKSLERLKELKWLLDWSYEKLAQELKVSDRSVRLWFSGGAKPRRKSLRKMRRYLNDRYLGE